MRGSRPKAAKSAPPIVNRCASWPGAGRPRPDPPLESTADLLTLARGGDERAVDRLFARYIPVLARWAHQRLPHMARDLVETDDLVQVTLMRALRNLNGFVPLGEGAFLGYLRQILLNAIRDEVRRTHGRRAPLSLDDQAADPGASALDEAVGRDTMDRYEAGLARLNPQQREAVILKVEMGFSNAEIAAALGKSSVDAARMLVARALVDLAESMHERD